MLGWGLLGRWVEVVRFLKVSHNDIVEEVYIHTDAFRGTTLKIQVLGLKAKAATLTERNGEMDGRLRSTESRTSRYLSNQRGFMNGCQAASSLSQSHIRRSSQRIRT